MSDERLLTMKETAAYLNIGYQTFRNYLSKKPDTVPPHITIGNIKRWRVTDLDTWITARQSGK